MSLPISLSEWHKGKRKLNSLGKSWTVWNYLDPKIPATYQPNEPITEQALIQRALACREQLRTLGGRWRVGEKDKWEQEIAPPLAISSLQLGLWVKVTISNAHSVIMMGSRVGGDPWFALDTSLWLSGGGGNNNEHFTHLWSWITCLGWKSTAGLHIVMQILILHLLESQLSAQKADVCDVTIYGLLYRRVPTAGVVGWLVLVELW